MLLIFISVLLSIAVFIGLGTNNEGYHFGFKLNKKQIFCVLPLFLMTFNMFKFIQPNNVGILYNPFNGIKEEVLQEGFQFKGMLDKVYLINTEVQTKTLAKITGQTKDSQWVDMTVDVKYRVNSVNAFRVFREFRNLKNIDEKLIQPVVQRSIETITTKYNIMEVLGEKRNQVYTEIEQVLKERFAESGIDFYFINFDDVEAGAEIEGAITKQAVAKQAVETAEQERLKAEIDSQKRIVEAKADLEKAKIEAEQALVVAEGQNKANELLRQSITNELLQKMWIDKWNGIMPQVITDGNVMIGLDKLN